VDFKMARFTVETTMPIPESNATRLLDSPRIPIVCLGMSAGGILPLKAIFEGLSAETGLAFVVIHHLRNIPTKLPQILKAWTKMPVVFAIDGGFVRPNTVYVLPSGMELALSDATFLLRPQRKRHGFSNVLTIFLESLATSGHPGIGVILSGLDADGTAALEAFRRHGGVIIAQDPRTAERIGMPPSAILRGVDEVLPPGAIANKLESLAQQFRTSAV
jgi:chemotaxis response regulator CheB